MLGQAGMRDVTAFLPLDSCGGNGKLQAVVNMPSPHDHGEIESDDQVQVQHEQAPRKASRYRVVFYNDDYTTMEFVVETLMQFFAKSEVEATRIMLEVHHKGRGVAGTYIRDVAESKVDQVEAHARAHGHPLKCTAEPADISLDSQP